MNAVSSQPPKRRWVARAPSRIAELSKVSVSVRTAEAEKVNHSLCGCSSGIWYSVVRSCSTSEARRRAFRRWPRRLMRRFS